MKKIIIRSLIIVMALICCIPSVWAADYGTVETSCDIRYFVTSGVVNVHSKPSVKSNVVRKINAGDYVYVDNDTLYYNAEDAWVKVSGADEYVLSYLLTIEDNPNFKRSVTNDNILETKTSLFNIGLDYMPKWLGITMFSVWILLSLILCLLYLNDYRMDLRWCPPNKKPQILQSLHPEFGFGQSKVLFFSPSLYKLFALIAMFFVVAFIVTIILFILVGGLVWLSTWGGRIVFVGLYWILLVGLWVLTVAVTIAGFSFGVVGALLGFLPGALAVWFGEFREDVADIGYSMVEWGERVFSTFNIFDFALYIVEQYWLTALIISLLPLLLFVCAAILFMIFAGALSLYENIKMKRYNVSHPCPFCGEHSEPAVYLSKGVPLHVPLRPSVWGMFNIMHPATGEIMPTLFLNGKDRLERRCVHCDGLISAHIGVEKHIAVAGVPNSGKSTLLYRIISEFSRMKVENESVFSFTDNMGVNETVAQAFLETIKDGQKMNYFPEKTSEGRHKSIQMLAYSLNSSLPYRVYVNDIAGELFTATNNQYEDAPFFKNTNVLIFALDPFTMRASELDFSPEFASWYKNNIGDKNDWEGKVDLDEAFSALINTISKYRKEKDFSKIKLMITFVKTDTGYLNDLSDRNNEELLREFALSEMGLGSLISKLESVGFNVSYHSLSASDDVNKSGVSTYIDCILDNLDISFKNLSAKQIADRKYKSLKSSILSNVQFRPIKNPNEKHRVRNCLVIVSSFIIGGLLISATVKYNTGLQERNYDEIIQLVNSASSKSINYDEVMSIVETSLAEKSLSEAHKKELTNIYMTADREKRKHISKLRSILYANFEPKKGGMSNFELSLKYKVGDVKTFQQYFDEFRKLSPEDALYLKYRDMFDKLLTKYKVSK